MLIFDIVRFSNEVVTKRECLLKNASEENADMDTWKIHSFNTIPFPFPFPSKYSLVGCHGDGGTVSRNNVRTTIFQLLRNRRK